ncbi:hypothetical protein SAMN02927921_02156 [Sinomicrobium oceani]|uniref:Uncharacterized protein n=1 Tax=Sinomicrobium oceani TaxID=1150368 RepID=A0A1K1PZ66_9FLAO|nr:hypothetical protein [Sinomicrobium oceani]SFW52793.1 hypothetical protein SAMN02927921_02156 [Sinomicrobium oceani]
MINEEYYSIRRSDDLQETGHYPQAHLRKGYNPRKNGHFMVKHYEFPDFAPNLELEMHPKTIPTNYLNNTAGLINGFIVDSKFKLMMSSFKLPRHHFYPIKAYKGSKLFDYYWLHYIVDDFWEFIDTANSYGEVFEFKTPFETVVTETFAISSKNQVLEEKRKYKLGRTRIGKIIMKKEFPQYDLYKIDCLSYTTILSEKLKNAIVKAGITGMEIKPFNKFLIGE